MTKLSDFYQQMQFHLLYFHFSFQIDRPTHLIYVKKFYGYDEDVS